MDRVGVVLRAMGLPRTIVRATGRIESAAAEHEIAALCRTRDLGLSPEISGRAEPDVQVHCQLMRCPDLAGRGVPVMDVLRAVAVAGRQSSCVWHETDVRFAAFVRVVSAARTFKGFPQPNTAVVRIPDFALRSFARVC